MTRSVLRAFDMRVSPKVGPTAVHVILGSADRASDSRRSGPFGSLGIDGAGPNSNGSRWAGSDLSTTVVMPTSSS